MDSFKKMFILSAVVLFTTFKLGLAPRVNFSRFYSKFKRNKTENEGSAENKQQENKRKIYFIRQFFIFSRQPKMSEKSTCSVATEVQTDHPLPVKRRSSFRHMYQFSMALCLKSSLDLKSWLGEFIYDYTSIIPLDIINDIIYNNIKTTIFNWHAMVTLSILGLQIIGCISLIGGILYEPGVIFMFVLIAAVCAINIHTIIGNISTCRNIHKDKSKEI